MESFASLEKIAPIFKKNILAIGLGVVGLLFLASGLFSILSQSKDEITFETSQGISASDSARIAVDVSGAVIKPGLYTLTEGSRIQDALVSAGGLSQEADREWVEKNINLALKLKDGVKIYFPRISEQGSVQGLSTSETGSLININSASSRELESLPGIGPVTAGKIIDSRPYSSIDELVSKKAVSSKVFDQIKDKVAVY